MKYNKEKWLKRIRLRSDISGFVAHFTKENNGISSIDILIKILKEKRIKGSTTDKGFIVGNFETVCFQDAPIHGLTQNLIHEQYYRETLGNKIRYSPIGLGFSKRYVYLKGARPVIYEKKEIAKKFLSESEWWRIVSFDLSDDENIIDWTHEREWRIKGDFAFELNEVYVYLVNQNFYKQFLEKADDEIIKNIQGIVVLDPILT